ncbi:hypothetical protein EU537_09060 [Candidatus Thorarchaeota archaeon]|nr:MAG: hypothetical protein EU537_09060 [Candidatus Thorarchaeota archaeon]
MFQHKGFTCLLVLILSSSYTISLTFPFISTSTTTADITLTEHARITIESNADFAEQAASEGWPGDGSLLHPYKIQGYRISSDSTCIRISDTTVHFQITSCQVSISDASSGVGVYLHNVTNGDVLYTNFTGGLTGIYLYQSEDCILTSNRVEKCSHNGVRVERSNHCSVRNSTIKDCDTGILVDSSPHSRLLYNQIQNATETGIYIEFSFYCEAIENSITLGGGDAFEIHFSTHSELIENVACLNTGVGILVSGGGYDFENNTAYGNPGGGMALEDCGYSSLIGNRLHSNGRNGLSLNSSENNTIRENWLYANIQFGLALDEASDFNQIYGNLLGWNLHNNSRDDGTNNEWCHGVDTGNSWSDYLGGAVYRIPGTGNATDRYPTHLIDNAPPEITPHQDIEYIFGTKDNVLVYTPVEQFPHRFSVYKNGTTFQLGHPWDMRPVRINVDHLPPGSHEFEVMIYDAQGNRAYDQVMVLVQPGNERTAPWNTIVVRMAISAFLVGLALLLVEFGRKWSKGKENRALMTPNSSD